MISKKLIISALSTGMGVSLVGAITGTVAWYQYSTRSTVSFVGTSLASSKNLLISFDNSDYDNDLTHAQANLTPITTGAMLANAALPGFKAQPIYQHFEYSKWISADAGAYVQFDLYLKYNEMDDHGNYVPVAEQKSVYLSDLLIRQHNGDEQKDISDAVRVHIAYDGGNMLLSNKGETIDVHGALDLNGDGVNDKTKAIYSFYSQSEIDAIPDGVYGEGTQAAYKLSDVDPDVANDGTLSDGTVLGTLFSKAVKPADGTDVSGGTYFTNPDLADEHVATGTANGTDTYYVSQNVLHLSITIWIEGWQELDQVEYIAPAANTDLAAGDYYTDAECQNHATGTANGTAEYYHKFKSAMWDTNSYLGSEFDVGLMFEVDA